MHTPAYEARLVSVWVRSPALSLFFFRLNGPFFPFSGVQYRHDLLSRVLLSCSSFHRFYVVSHLEMSFMFFISDRIYLGHSTSFHTQRPTRKYP